MNSEENLEPLFKIVERRGGGKAIEGDVGRVPSGRERVGWRSELYTTFLEEGGELLFRLKPQDGPFIKNLKSFLEGSGISQGYVRCEGGILNDVRCGFFMTKHKPTATFAEASFTGKNEVLSISGFFLSIQRSEVEGAQPTIVPHVHITLEREEEGKTLGGHLIEAESGQLECRIVPLEGARLRRETDPNTGVMHIRSAKAEREKRREGEVMLFALAPGEDFPNKLAEALSRYGVEKGSVNFAVGTLWKASLREGDGELTFNPQEGLEVLFTEGEIYYRKGEFSHRVKVHLIDRYGRLVRAQILRGEVKDLVEGLMEVGSY